MHNYEKNDNKTAINSNEKLIYVHLLIYLIRSAEKLTDFALNNKASAFLIGSQQKITQSKLVLKESNKFRWEQILALIMSKYRLEQTLPLTISTEID